MRSKTVQPTSDFKVLDGGERLIYYAKSLSRWRQLLALLIAIPSAFIGIGATMVGGGMVLSPLSASDVKSGPDILTLGIAGLVVFGFAMWWARRARRRPIEFDKTSITIGRKKYLLEHVASIGWSAQSGFTSIGSGYQAAAAMMAHDSSGRIVMQYGGDEVVIVQGVQPDQVQVVYGRIVSFLERFGYRYTPAAS